MQRIACSKSSSETGSKAGAEKSREESAFAAG